MTLKKEGLTLVQNVELIFYEAQMRRYPQRVENYTNAFLVTTGIILFMAFFTLAATVGIIWVMLTAALIDSGVRIREARLRARATGQDGRRGL